MMHSVEIAPSTTTNAWPALPLEAWRESYATLHMYTQIVGKLPLALCPHTNQWWQVALHVTPRGLATAAMPYASRSFDVEFDLVDHRLAIRVCDGAIRTLPLRARPVADFYRDVHHALAELGISVRTRGVPCEVPDPVPFAEDTRHASYDPVYVARFFTVLRQMDAVFKTFRAGFRGKCSPVHFFWGSFDLAVTRFSGRRAPPREGADVITRVAYDEEVSSLGFWPGGNGVDGAALYAYTVPAPKGLGEATVRPSAAYFDPRLGEHLLMYDEIRRARDPVATVLEFAQSTYEAGATLAGWDRAALEYAPAR